MNKIYQRIDWENYPSSATPLNEDNLNKMDYTIDKLDDRIVTHETTKLDTATGNSLVKDVTFDETTGIFTIEKLSGSKITINTALEKISTNFHFNPTTQKLALTLIDGTTQEVDLSALITQYEFIESDTITFEIDANGKVKANILNGSITGEKLEPNYLADVTLQANNAKTSADNAKTSEELAYQYAEDARQSASETQKNNASNISYDNATSGLTSDNVQGAIDEIKENLNKKADNNPYYMTSSTAGYGSGGYVAFARLEVKSSYQNSPIEFELICRGRKESCRVSIQFEGSSANDPAIKALLYTGADYGVFARKINTSIWELYYTKSENYDLLTVTRISHVNGLAVEITHPGTYLSTKPTTTIVNASLGCAVASAETATKAIQDGEGNVITETYATKEDLGNFDVTVDSALSTTSTNPVQNKVITTSLNGKADKSSVLSTLTECTASTTPTDIASASALAELSKVETATVNVGDFIEGATGAIEFRKVGRTCQVLCHTINNLNYTAWSSNYVIAKIPEKFRPIKDSIASPLIGDGYAIIKGRIVFQTDDSITLTSSENVTVIAPGSITYVTAI